jgi:hypothetical protein
MSVEVCSVMFRERERFTKHRVQVIGADGVDLKTISGPPTSGRDEREA